jgi:OOP family OmpA-OmpF porin
MKKIATTLLLSAAISAPAFAADQGAYLSVDAGTLSMSNAGLFKNPGAIDLIGGYRFTKNVAVEAGYMIIGDTTLTDAFGSITYKQSAMHAGGVFTLPLGESFGLFGKLGVNSVSGKLTGTSGYAGTNSSTSTTNVTYGIGGQYNFNQHFAAKVQYEKLGKTKADTTAPGSDLTRVSAGMIYSF